ncbi:MAG: hypothetical protein D0530_04900 [Methylococcales bacterium]|nr:MAG: hypothetical protein D0530_04900 [Methylococcales bacterium]
MSTPAQMFDHELNPIKGWPSPYALDKALNVKSGEPAIYAGSVVSIDPTTGALRLGLIDNAMPLFAFQNSYDLDVVGDDGNLVGQGTSTPRINTLVAVGSYELESTQFVAGSYAPNAQLTSPAPAAANAGLLTSGAFGTNTICGIVSDGTLTNEFRKGVIRFWPVFLPHA